MPSSHFILCHPLLLLPQSIPAPEYFPMSGLFTRGGQSIGVSALASFLPKNTQDWSPSEWTGWISLVVKCFLRPTWLHIPGCLALGELLESITMNKASGGDGIPDELFQILQDDVVKVLHSICQQIWKTQQWPQDWKRSIFIPIPKKGNAKEWPNYHTIVLISHASKIMLKILQARLQKYMNWELPDVQARFRKGKGTRDQFPVSVGS